MQIEVANCKKCKKKFKECLGELELDIKAFSFLNKRKMFII